MKKLSLRIEELRVDSLAAEAGQTRGGTAVGAQAVLTRRYEETCQPWACVAPTEPGFGTYVDGMCVRC